MSKLCGIYSPGAPELATPEILAGMADAMQQASSSVRCFHDQQAGLGLAYAFLPAFTSGQGDAPERWYEDDELVIALDGAIYDAPAPSAQESHRDGHTAALAARYRESGPAFVSKVEGNFNLVLWDRRSSELHIASDRLGSRLLYYYYDAARNLLVFASELKAVLRHPAVRRELDYESLSLYLAVSYLPAPHCVIKDARKIFPAQLLKMGREGGLMVDQYWRVPPPDKRDLAFEEWVPLVRQQMESSLVRLTESTPRLGVYLSGGSDSSYLLAALKNTGRSECLSLTFGIRGGRASLDQEWARRVASDIDVRHRPVEVGPEDVTPALLGRLMARLDEPGNFYSAVADHFLAEAAAEEGLSSCVTGDGGELPFDAAGNWPDVLEARAAGGMVTDEDAVGMMFKHGAFLDEGDQEKLLRRPPFSGLRANQLIDRHLDEFSEFIQGGSAFEFSMAVYLIRAWPPKYMTKFVLAPLSGVEVREGFRDVDLLRFYRSIPGKFRNEEAAAGSKPLLSAAYGSLVPSLAERSDHAGLPGLPWASPGYDWLRPVVFEGLERLKETGLVVPEAVDKLVEKFRSRRKNSDFMKISYLFGLQMWLDYYVDDFDPFAGRD